MKDKNKVYFPNSSTGNPENKKIEPAKQPELEKTSEETTKSLEDGKKAIKVKQSQKHQIRAEDYDKDTPASWRNEG